jgi:hypothetical protein
VYFVWAEIKDVSIIIVINNFIFPQLKY